MPIIRNKNVLEKCIYYITIKIMLKICKATCIYTYTPSSGQCLPVLREEGIVPGKRMRFHLSC